jgi:hypothetical protein
LFPKRDLSLFRGLGRLRLSLAKNTTQLKTPLHNSSPLPKEG